MVSGTRVKSGVSSAIMRRLNAETPPARHTAHLDGRSAETPSEPGSACRVRTLPGAAPKLIQHWAGSTSLRSRPPSAPQRMPVEEELGVPAASDQLPPTGPTNAGLCLPAPESPPVPRGQGIGPAGRRLVDSALPEDRIVGVERHRRPSAARPRSEVRPSCDRTAERPGDLPASYRKIS